MKKYSDNLVDRMGGWVVIGIIGVLGLVLGMIEDLIK